jgi:hypothetical protein
MVPENTGGWDLTIDVHDLVIPDLECLSGSTALQRSSDEQAGTRQPTHFWLQAADQLHIPFISDEHHGGTRLASGHHHLAAKLCLAGRHRGGISWGAWSGAAGKRGRQYPPAARKSLHCSLTMKTCMMAGSDSSDPLRMRIAVPERDVPLTRK